MTLKAANDSPLPDPRLLGLHAACARIAVMSGAAEVLQKWENDAEDARDAVPCTLPFHPTPSAFAAIDSLLIGMGKSTV